MAKTSAAQLDREIAAALAQRPIGRPRKAIKSASPSKTLRHIATRAFPEYKGRKIVVEVADHVDRQVDSLYYGASDDQMAEDGTLYRDVLLKLTMLQEGERPGRPLRLVKRPDVGRVGGSLHTEIPFGSAYVSTRGKNSSITIYLPPIDQTTIDVAVDATLESGGPTPDVTRMIENALESRTGSAAMISAGLRDAYVALVAQLARTLSVTEAKAGYR